MLYMQRLIEYPNSRINQRIASTRRIHAFKSNFIRNIHATPCADWVDMLDKEGLDTESIFSNDMLLLPFDGHGQKSLFVILNAGGIRDYTKRNYWSSRPCIMHLDPNKQAVAHHDFNNIANRLRTWMNKLWRDRISYLNDPFLVPFNHRSMPLCRPTGMYLVQFLT